MRGERPSRSAPRGFAALLIWTRDLGEERVWALEDCRHVSGAFERFLVGRGERVLRVLTRLMADVRRAARERGKSDSIDALAVARAALREGVEKLPGAQLDRLELDLRLLVDHRERLVRQRVALNSTLQWHLHDLWPELELPADRCSTATGARGSPGAYIADGACIPTALGVNPSLTIAALALRTADAIIDELPAVAAPPPEVTPADSP